MMNKPLNQDIIDRMIDAVTRRALEEIGQIAADYPLVTGPDINMIAIDKEFKYGKGKEYIAFTDAGKNQFGKDVKYVKFFYYYSSTAKLKPNDKTYTFGLEKARLFWNDKVKEGYSTVKNSTPDEVENPVDTDVSQVETTT